MKNKKYILLTIIIYIAGTFSSCNDYLSVERYFKDRQNEDRIFADKDYTYQWLSFCYSQLMGENSDMASIDNNITNFSDDMIFNERSNGERYRMYKFGEYDYSWLSKSWDMSYQGIRQASILIYNVHKNEDISQEEIQDIKGQARFIRAYLYWLLLRKYGPVPIMPENGADYTGSYDELSFPRNSYDECVDYITKEMLQAAHELNADRTNTNIASPTKGAALAVRAKVYLFGASPLANGNSEMADFKDKNGRILISQVYDESKWAKAAAAARDVIELNKYKLYTMPKRSHVAEAYPATIEPPYHPVYSTANFPDGWADIDPFESYRSLFNGELFAVENPELIFTRGQNDKDGDGNAGNGITSMVMHQMPISLSGYNSHGVTAKQCDAYEMNDGTPFDRSNILSGYVTAADVTAGRYKPLKQDVHLGYANREPRFYASIAYNGAVWPSLSATLTSEQYKQIWYYRGESNGRSNASERWIPTGIGMMKFVHPNDCKHSGGTVIAKIEPTIRYADILLLYAEALNELTGTHEIQSWDGSKTYTIRRDVNEMSKATSQVRIRAGLPDYDETTYSDANNFRKKLKHERQIEFFGENHRYYDLRRWKDAPIDEAEQVYGCNTLMTKNYRDDFHKQVRVSNLQTAFSRKMYFWPITYNELKRNKNMTQSPGWQDYD